LPTSNAGSFSSRAAVHALIVAVAMDVQSCAPASVNSWCRKPWPHWVCLPPARCACMSRRAKTSTRPGIRSPPKRRPGPQSKRTRPITTPRRALLSARRAAQLLAAAPEKRNTQMPCPNWKNLPAYPGSRIFRPRAHCTKPMQRSLKKCWPLRGSLPCACRSWCHIGYAWDIARATSTATTAPWAAHAGLRPFAISKRYDRRFKMWTGAANNSPL